MTYCVGIKAKDGIIIASDSRTNAGLDNVNIYSKMYTYIQNFIVKHILL